MSASNAHRKTNNQPIILSLSKFFRARSKERTKKRFAFGRDLVWSLGDLLNRCNIPLASHQDFRRDPASAKCLAVLLVRFAQPAKLRLRKTQAFFSAQDDRLTACFYKNRLFNDLNVIHCSPFQPFFLFSIKKDVQNLLQFFNFAV